MATRRGTWLGMLPGKSNDVAFSLGKFDADLAN